jgi:hypothetical protein
MEPSFESLTSIIHFHNTSQFAFLGAGQFECQQAVTVATAFSCFPWTPRNDHCCLVGELRTSMMCLNLLEKVCYFLGKIANMLEFELKLRQFQLTINRSESGETHWCSPSCTDRRSDRCSGLNALLKWKVIQSLTDDDLLWETTISTCRAHNRAVYDE